MEPPVTDKPDIDRLAALRLQVEWGADEALEDAPVNRLPSAPAGPSRPASMSRVGAPDAAAPAKASADTPGQIIHPVQTQAAHAAARAGEAAAAAGDLAALRAAIAAFDGCALRDTASQLVFAEGDASRGLLLIGDSPAADEDRTGRPFAGTHGAYLDGMLDSIGVSRSEALLAPLIPWRPPGDRPPSAAELAACLPFLWRLIALVQPRHIVLFSGLAARALLPAVQRRRPRGTWVALSVPGLTDAVPTLAAASPGAVRISPAQRRLAWADLRRLSRALRPTAIPENPSQ